MTELVSLTSGPDAAATLDDFPSELDAHKERRAG